MSLELYRNEAGKIEVKVPVTYEVADEVSITVDSLEELEKLLDDHNYVDQMPLGDDPQYLDGSYEVNREILDCYIEDFKEKEEQQGK